MQTIYQSSAFSFLDSMTRAVLTHPQGDYSCLNPTLKRLEYLVQTYQPEKPVIFLHTAPSCGEKNVEHTHLLVELQPSGIPAHEKIFMGQMNNNRSIDSFNLPRTHAFLVPPLGHEREVTSIKNFNNFDSDSLEHSSFLYEVVNLMIARMEYFYDDYPLLHNQRVQFRRAKYVENRQAFSFWPTKKPQGEFLKSKPLFNSIMQKLDVSQKNYHMYIDFVQDWGKRYSMFTGEPENYSIEVPIFIDNIQVFMAYADCTFEEVNEFEYNHDLLDGFLEKLFTEINSNISVAINNINN